MQYTIPAYFLLNRFFVRGNRTLETSSDKCYICAVMESQYYRTLRKRFDLSRLLRNKRILVATLIGFPLLLYVLFGSHGIVQRIRLERQKVEVEASVKAAEEENLRLQAETKALESDMKALEKVAREKYGMVREGETVYKVRRNE